MGRAGGMEVKEISSLTQTDPVGGPPQGQYMNGAALVETELEAGQLLESLQTIEHELGRRRSVRWGPRTIDLDILLYGEEVIEEDALQIPHPRMHERRFVLEPLCEIAPGARHPKLKKTIRELCAACADG